ncbi:MAG: hypothetical protein CL607_03960 [Anaerolineaceae bacterium]|nr:hypothetical protein [Anaerolineaceae bacterium]
MSTNQRGCLYLVGLVIFAFFGCFLFPFIVLPAWGTAVTLPVITVPAEYYIEGWAGFLSPIQAIFPDFQLVNTLGGALLANIIVLLIAFFAWRASKGWTKEVPGRFQGFVELIGEIWWNLTKEQAGTKPKVKYILFPYVASIFLFLFAGNLGKLLPGVETVGVLHCAAYEPVALNGFPVSELGSITGQPYFVLRNDAALNTGQAGTDESYHRCEAMMGIDAYESYLPTQLDPFRDQEVTYVVEEGDTLESIAEHYNTDVLPELQAEAVEDGSEYVEVEYEGYAPVIISAESIIEANTGDDGSVNIVALAEDDHSAAADDHGEEAAADGETAEGEAAADDHAEEPVVEETAAITATTELEPGQTLIVREQLLGAEATTFQNQLFTVAPFVRGVSTDLSFTVGLALLAFVAIQAFGVSELGINYFQKFINVHALGNIAKRPLGAIDFVVGLFEIISEFGKIISLSFRLFGALFAGSVLFVVIMFLVGTTVPVIILALELIVGLAQAGVFAILTMLFCAQAMVAHVHDDEDHDHAEAH